MRILHVLPTRAHEYGGPIRIAELVCRHLRQRGHEADLFAPDGKKRPGYWPGLQALGELQAKVREADLVHIHGLWTVPTSAAGALARAFGRPYVITAHGMLDRWSLRQKALRKKMYAVLVESHNLNAASALHFGTTEERDEARELCLRAPTFVVPNGVDADSLRDLPGREDLWKVYPGTRGKTIVLFLGRIHPKKGLPILVKAFARIHERQPDVQLVVAGPDENGHRAEVEALAQRFDIAPHVLFTGPAYGQDKRLLLGAADVFVLPSHQEGDSVAIKEALCAGLPVLITHACHLPEVAESEAGLVVPPEVAAVSEALDKLCADASLRCRMGHNGRMLTQRNYRLEDLADQLIRHYEQALSRATGQRRARRSAVGG